MLILSLALLVAGCSKSNETTDTPPSVGGPSPENIAVLTQDITQFDATSATLGGSVSGVETPNLTSVGVEYLACDVAAGATPDWSAALSRTATVAATWQVVAGELTPQTAYAVRAFARTANGAFFGPTQTFTTAAAQPEPLTVAQLRIKHAASDDVSGLSVRGWVALVVPNDCTTESFPAGTVILYDNGGAAASAMIFAGGLASGLQLGDRVEVALAGAVRKMEAGLMPQYGQIGSAAVRVLDRGTAVDPVWATPAQLAAQSADYVCSPVRVSRVYARMSDVLFSVADNRFTDGENDILVYAKAGSVVGQLTQNSATGTLCGICSYAGQVQVVPVNAADVAGFTTPDGSTVGDAKIELLNDKQHYEFAPQGGTLIVDCRITRPANLRLFADMRFVDASRYAIDIEGDRVCITARANTTGAALDEMNCYLYLAESKDATRKATASLYLSQLGNQYESIPALITANGGENSKKEQATVNGNGVYSLKLGSGSYTGHYTSDPLGVSGRKRLVLYAVGWQEGDHAAGTLYLRVENGGSASVASIPLRINAGATGMAPYVLTVGSEDRYEVSLTDLTPGSAISFSTSPTFDKKKDDKTGRALLVGVQLLD